MPKDELVKLMFSYDKDQERFPVKILQFNRCPAVAPMSVLDETSQKRLKIDLKKIANNLNKLLANPDFNERVKHVVLENEHKRQTSFVVDIKDVDAQLYEGFFGDDDQDKMQIVRSANEDKLVGLNLDFSDKRLEQMLLLFKARQHPNSLTVSEQKQWEDYRKNKLFSSENSLIDKYFARIGELSTKDTISNEQKFLLEELQLYGESLIPY
jgi:exodeoxyribonuclease-1